MPLQAGATLQGGKYTVQKLLGEGATSAVYLVTDQAGNQRAVKQLDPVDAQGRPVTDEAELERFREDFEREVRLIARLTHPHIPRVYDFFEEWGTFYYVMDYVAGKTLLEVLADYHGRIPEALVLEWLPSICAVLNYLHEQKPQPIIFRDIKPENLILAPDGTLRLIDFGIARRFDPAKRRDTVAIGTPGYLSPEHQGGQTDPRSDLFSLGATLHHLLSGKDPQKSPRPFDYPPVPDISPDLQALLDRLLQLDPDRRYQSVSELMQDYYRRFRPQEAVEGSPCPDCGAFNPPARFCRHCGHLFEQQRPVDSAVGPAAQRVQQYAQLLPPPPITFNTPRWEALRRAVEADRRVPEETFQLRLLAEKVSATEGFDTLLCLDSLDIDHLRHQEQTAQRVLREMRGRALLADEVGLGKTIEAGIVMKELIVRRLVRNVLILTPPALTEQWKWEMQEKFHEDFAIFGQDTPGRDLAAWSHPRLIASIEVAKRQPHRARLLQGYYDLVIVDEAHWLRHRRTQRYALVRDIPKKYLLLLTATPVHNDLEELFNLISLLKPGQLSDLHTFHQQFVDPQDPRRPRQVERLRTLIQEVMVRNRRKEVFGLHFPERRASAPEDLGLTREEQAIYQELRHLAQRGHYSRARGRPLLEAFCSSAAAFRPRLERQAADSLAPAAQQVLQGLVPRARQLPSSNKVRLARETLRTWLRGARDKALIFTKYAETVEHLAQELQSEFRLVTVTPGLTPAQRHRRLQEFETSAQVMIATEQMSEGLNLQFCNMMINFDLPWNPMRIEQRIGRIQRIGQRHDVIILNLYFRDTVEEYILEVCRDKLKMFEAVIGQVEMILGELVSQDHIENLIWSHHIGDHKTEEQLTQELIDRITHLEESRTVSEEIMNQILGNI
jgi:superfamily II DNA or RNA helicase